MRFSTSVLASLTSALLSVSTVDAGCQFIGGNTYCNSVSAVQYQNLGFSGSYMDVNSIDESSCQCSQSQLSFSGSMAPLDEELSVHFRGPVQLKQFGVYYPSGSSFAKRDEAAEDCTTTKHVHHQHKRAPKIEYQEVTKTVYKDMDGNIIDNVPDGLTIATGETAQLTTLVTSTTENGQNQQNTPEGTTSPSTSSSSSSTSSSSAAAAATTKNSGSNGNSSGGWNRSSYYTPGSGDNVVFMNHQGGTAGSGVWSSCFGNSISFAASNGIDGASSPQALDDVLVASNHEYMIFSGNSCSDQSAGDCGYTREGIPAYHGFAGSDKIFVFEFQMPKGSGDSSVYNHDMPAIWLLNAKIPRTLQYGNSECSCWSTGCGELDLFEVLSAGSDKLTNHLHCGQGASSNSNGGGGGTADYIARPYDSTMKAAVVFKNSSVSIVVLDDSTDFSSSLSSDTVDTWLNTQGSVANLV